MIPFVSPLSGKPLTAISNQLVSDNGEVFPIVNGIPRFVASNNYASAFGLQWNRFTKTQLDSFSGLNLSHERLERCLGLNLNQLKGKNVLEVGCGAGRFTELLVKAGANTHAIDLSNAVEANLQNIGSKPNYCVAQASVYELPFPDNAFDVVLCIGVIQHTPSSRKTIAELWKKVKVGGLLVIDHYRWRLSYFATLKPVYRHYLKRLSPEKSKKAIDRFVDFYFPLHWKVRNNKPAWWLLHRISPLIEYINLYPEKDYEFHLEWSRLESYDALTDYYKHLKTAGQIRHYLEDLGGKNIWINLGGNGVEARCTK